MPYATLLSFVKTNVYDQDRRLSAIEKIKNDLK